MLRRHPSQSKPSYPSDRGCSVHSIFLDQDVSISTELTARIETLELCVDISNVRNIWKSMHAGGAGSPYQSFEWYSAWLATIGKNQRWSALVVLARDSSGDTIALVPLVVRKRFGISIVEFAGGKHSNLNMPLVTASFSSKDSWSLVRCIMTAVQNTSSGPIVLRLLNMPKHWHDRRNPMAAGQVNPNGNTFYRALMDEAYTVWFDKQMSSHRRRRLEYNTKKLSELGVKHLEGSHYRARERIVDAFLFQKTTQLQKAGIVSDFDDKTFRQFLLFDADSCDARTTPAIQLFALEAAGEIVSTLGAAIVNGAMSVMFLSFSSASIAAKFSPGDVLIWQTLQTMHGRGIRQFDLGAGDANYKRRFCPEAVPLYNLFLGHKLAGRLSALLFGVHAFVKSWVKSKPPILSLARRVIRGAYRVTGAIVR